MWCLYLIQPPIEMTFEMTHYTCITLSLNGQTNKKSYETEIVLTSFMAKPNSITFDIISHIHRLKITMPPTYHEKTLINVERPIMENWQSSRTLLAGYLLYWFLTLIVRAKWQVIKRCEREKSWPGIKCHQLVTYCCMLGIYIAVILYGKPIRYKYLLSTTDNGLSQWQETLYM